jgi:uncharacterized protein with ParB-like and HNH nuclease domain
MKIESQDITVDKLLKSSTFVIPRFQRAYSWEPDHVTEFWNDVIANLRQSYFIGSMVVYKVGRSSVAVVDGQQRLTTVTILLCAVREGFKKLSQTDLANGLQAYIEQKDRENKTVYVLQTETSFPYLQEEVLKNGPADAPYEIGREEESIQKAYEILIIRLVKQLKYFFQNVRKIRKLI